VASGYFFMSLSLLLFCLQTGGMFLQDMETFLQINKSTNKNKTTAKKENAIIFHRFFCGVFCFSVSFNPAVRFELEVAQVVVEVVVEVAVAKKKKRHPIRMLGWRQAHLHSDHANRRK